MNLLSINQMGAGLFYWPRSEIGNRGKPLHNQVQGIE